VARGDSSPCTRVIRQYEYASWRVTLLLTVLRNFHARESLVRAGYADTPARLRMTHVYAALAHVHITQGRALRLCVTRAVYLVLHLGFVRISGKPRYAGYVWGRNPSTLFRD
jgi:hypothetical protein